MNLQGQQQKLSLEFNSYIERLIKFLTQNKNFSGRCLKRIQIISSEIVTAEEKAAEEQQIQDNAESDPSVTDD
jgi:hypothetical protein